MRYTNRMSGKQEAFIRELRNGTLTVDQLKKKEEANRKQFSRWFRNKFFWLNVKQAVRESERRALVETHLIAVEARATIGEAVKTKKPLLPDELATCNSALNQNREDKRLDRVVQRRRKRKPRVDSERDLVHPRFKHEEAELLAILQDGR